MLDVRHHLSPGCSIGAQLVGDHALRRDAFLLRYIGSVDLRRTIGAATDKSEHFNRYAQWAGFRGGGLVTAAARDEQRKMVKYNHLVANLLIFHTAIGMTRALDGIVADGFGDAVSPEGIATLRGLRSSTESCGD